MISSDMEAKVSTAVVGLGYWGPNLARNLAASDRTTLAGLCDLDDSRLQGVAAHHPAAKATRDVEEILADPSIDAVSIATPVRTHFELARAALLAGKHVLIEKPFTSSSLEARELIDLAARTGRVLMIDHVFIYSPPVRKLKEIVDSGEIGELQFIDSVRINLGLFQEDVNVIWDLAPHDLSIIDHLLGRPPLRVMATGSCHTGNGLANVAYLHLDYGDDVLVSLHVNWMSPVKIRHFLVGGSRRSVLYNDLDPSEPIKVYDRGIDLQTHPEDRRQVMISYRSGDVISPRVDRTEALQNVVEHFADRIVHGVTPISGGEQGLRLVRILEAADLSLAKGGAQVELTDV